MKEEIAHKTILISGGSSGIGNAVSILLAEKGAKVYSLDVKKPIKEALGVQHINCDVSDFKQVSDASSTIKEQIDILINNAAVLKRGSLFSSSEEDFNDIFNINVKGSWNLLKCFEKKMSENPIFIQISSMHGMAPTVDPGLYSLSKTTVLALAKLVQMTKPNWTVKTISPGPVSTPMALVGVKDLHAWQKKKRLSSDEMAEMIIGHIFSDNKNLYFDENENRYLLN